MTRTVLIVDPNILQRKQTEQLLRTMGCRIISTWDGMETLTLARQHRPDLILIELKLAHLSGLQVAKWLKADSGLKDTPIVALAGWSEIVAGGEIRDAGLDDFVGTPIRPEAFVATLGRYVA